MIEQLDKTPIFSYLLFLFTFIAVFCGFAKIFWLYAPIQIQEWFLNAVGYIS